MCSRLLVQCRTWRVCSNLTVIRTLAAQAKKEDSGPSSIQQRPAGPSEVSTATKVAAATKTASYFGSILIAGGVIVGIGYALFKELFADEGPIQLMGIAVEKYKYHPHVVDIVGSSIKVFGRIHYNKHARRHPEYATYTDSNGKRFVQITFVMNGEKAASHVFVEFREKDEKSFWGSNWEIVYATLKNKSNGRLYLLEDNRKLYQTDQSAPEITSNIKLSGL